MGGIQSIDKEFIKRAAEEVINHLDNKSFSGNELAAVLHLSREQTHRKLKKDTALSTGKFILYIRLLKAHNYIRTGNFTMAEICYKVGFDSPAYFNKCFKDAWGISPGEIRKSGESLNLTDRPVYHFYQIPEIGEVLHAGNIMLTFPEKKKKKLNRPMIWMAAGIATILLVIATVVLSHKKRAPVVTLNDNSRIAIIPFTNQTGDTVMNPIGDIASSWISGQLDELEGVKTVPFFTLKEYQPYLAILPNDPQNRPTLSELVHAKYFITGSYFIKDKQLFFDTRLLDAHSQELVYHMPIINGPKDSVMQVVEKLRLKIAGLVTNLEEVKLGKLIPPDYQAYQNYLLGLAELKVGMTHSRAKHFFEKAVQIEPAFPMAQVFLSWFCTSKERDSIVQSIGENPRLTKYEHNVYLEFKNLLDRNHKEALNICLRSLKEYPQDYYFNLIAGHRAKSMFQPTLAMRVLSQLHDPLNSKVGLVWHYFKVRNYVESLNMLGRYDESLAYLQSIPVDLQTQAVPTLLINVYVKLGKSRQDVEAYIEKIIPRVDKFYAEDLITAAYEFGLVSEMESSQYFAEKAIDVLKLIEDKQAGFYDVVDAFYLSNKLSEAKSYLLKKLKSDSKNDDLLIYLALIEASLGNDSRAEEIFSKFQNQPLVDWRRHEFQYQTDYLKARIYALGGKKDTAVALLRSALTKGQLRHHWDFERDIFLKPLFNYPPFQQLVGVDENSYITVVK